MEWVKLSDVCELITDGTHNTPKLEETGVPLYDGADIDKMKIYNESPKKYISFETDKELSIRCKPETDDVLISSRGSIGKVAIVLSGQDFNIMGNIILCRPKKGQLNPSYLAYNMLYKNADLQITAHGSSQKGLYLSQVRNIVIPLPPLETQKKITAALDKAQELIDKRNEQLAKLDEFVQSVFLEMFGELTCNSKRLKKGKIRDLVSDVRYGCSKKADAVNGNYPILRMNNINYAGYWDFSDLKYVDLDNKEVEKYLVYKGDLLFNRTNSKELVGKSAVYKKEEPVAYAGYLIRVRTNERAVPEYIWGYLNSSHGKLTLQNMCKNIIGMANINAQELQDINILIPPLDLQNQFAAIVEKTEQQKSLMQQSLAEMENNFNSLMQRAFKGELFS